MTRKSNTKEAPPGCRMPSVIHLETGVEPFRLCRETPQAPKYYVASSKTFRRMLVPLSPVD